MSCVDLSIETLVGGNMMAVVVIFCNLELNPIIYCLFHKAIQLENCLPVKIKYLCLLACEMYDAGQNFRNWYFHFHWYYM